MRRREFIGLLCGTAMTWPIKTRAQQALKVIGLLDPGISRLFEAFKRGMNALGYVEGQNISYIHLSAEGKADRIPPLARELVSKHVDVIITAASLPTRVAAETTSSIPIVFAALGDAVSTGVIKSLSQPGKNLTGLSFLNTEVSTKRIELLCDLFPKIQRVSVFDDPSSIRVFVEATQTAAVRRGVDLQVLQISSADGFEPAFQKAVAAQAQAVNVLASAFFNSNRQRLIDLAAQYRLPAMYEASDFTQDGGLISYGPNFPELFNRAAIYADKILKGASPSDIPVEQPSTFELVFNLKTAKALGLTIPESFLLRVDQVIE